MRCRILLLLSLLFALTACTPAYTVDQAQLYARKVGVTNQYDVRRWHNRSISPSSRLLVVVSAAVPGDSGFDARIISDAVRTPFSAAFAGVGALSATVSTASASRKARKGQYQFLLDVQRFEEKKAVAAGDNGQESAAQDADTTQPVADNRVPADVSRVVLEIALIDVHSGATVDKFFVSANTAIYNVVGTDLKTLLSKPLTRLAQDLTGL